MAAFSATKIDNALVEVNGPEIPILDGSSIEFVDSILKNGILEQFDKNKCFPKYFLKIETPIHTSLNDNDSEAWLFPTKCDKNKFIKNYNINYGENNNQNSIENIKFDFTLSGNIDFSENNLPQKHIKTAVSKFHEIAGARTFAFEKDIEFMRKNGLAKGGSLSNAVVFDNKGNALNKEKLRFNVVNPGFTKSSFYKKFKTKDKKLYNWTLSRIPNKKWAEPIEIAKLIHFLCSDESSYINGESISIDGGWTNT